MTSSTNYSKNLKNKRILLDHWFVLGAVSEPQDLRKNNLAFLFITEIAEHANFDLFVTDYCWGYVRENRNAIIQAVFDENATIIFKRINFERSTFQQVGQIRRLTPSAETNLNDATAFSCDYILTPKPELYKSTKKIEIVDPKQLLSMLSSH